MHQTTITFSDLRLSQRDGHKLRGYFSQQFGEGSDLWHNHRADGRPIYRYPLIQYKVLHQTPMLIGIGDGAPLLMQHFLEVQQLDIDGWVLPVLSKQINSRQLEVGVVAEVQHYRFVSPWFALNQKNHSLYQAAATADERQAILRRILISNILSFFKGVGHWEDQPIQLELDTLKPVKATFKNQSMLMFLGGFTANIVLPEYIGLGQSVSRGYGSIQPKENH
ncbi:MAG: DNA repair protein [Bacteroidetes bacterium]|nr:MAG: DNA repair protein [Bacteroidota bacterium]